jgi:hypothetical protein
MKEAVSSVILLDSTDNDYPLKSQLGLDISSCYSLSSKRQLLCERKVVFTRLRLIPFSLLAIFCLSAGCVDRVLY